MTASGAQDRDISERDDRKLLADDEISPSGAFGALGEGLFEIGLEIGDVEGMRVGYGGDAANTAVMAALCGCTSRLCGRVGADLIGHRLVDFWRAKGVDVAGVTHDSSGAPTGIYVNQFVGESHEFIYYRRQSAGSRLSPANVVDAFLDGLGVLHVSGITLAISDTAAAAATEAIARSRRRGAWISITLNHRPALGGDVDLLIEAARSADIIFVSAEESQTVLGASDLDEVIGVLGGRAREIVFTDGARGAQVATQEAVVRVQPPIVRVVDTAGAGDALAGAYLAARLAGHRPSLALDRAVVASALSCRKTGCASSFPTGEEVECWLPGSERILRHEHHSPEPGHAPAA